MISLTLNSSLRHNQRQLKQYQVRKRETLLHEQVHLWQQNFGEYPVKLGRVSDNNEFTEKCEGLGLHPMPNVGCHIAVADGVFIQLMNELGIPRSSFYYIVENNPEAIAEVQVIIYASNREQLGLILLSKTEMLRRIIEDGLSDSTKPKDGQAIYLKLNELVDRLTDTLHIESQLSKDAHEFLKRGPQLVHAQSRLTATETAITYETEG